jgi:hypothetical protein
MNEIQDITAKLAITREAIRKLEPILSQHPSRLSLQMNYQSLKKKEKRLQDELSRLTSRNPLDVSID